MAAFAWLSLGQGSCSGAAGPAAPVVRPGLGAEDGVAGQSADADAGSGGGPGPADAPAGSPGDAAQDAPDTASAPDTLADARSGVVDTAGPDADGHANGDVLGDTSPDAGDGAFDTAPPVDGVAVPDAAAPDASPDAGPDAAACPSPTATVDDPLRVLFLGNSYVATNDLPGTVVKLAASTGHTVVTASRAPGGYTLGAAPNAHATDAKSLALVAEGTWHVVVLQEQSQLPTIPAFFDAAMVPGAQALAAAVHDAAPCAQVMLFLTWGREAGGQQCAGELCSPPFADFAAMQASLTAAYLDVAAIIGASVAPVGPAWQASLAEAPGIDLFAPDGSHPSKAGSYLAAAVFHIALLGTSPEGASFLGGVAGADATTLQGVAAQTVLDDPGPWGLPW
jgi:hypothetical protein